MAASKLRVVARHGVGVDIIDLEAAKEFGVWVTNGPTSNINAVAEQTVGAIIVCARHLTACDRMVRAGEYNIRNTILGIELSGKTLGVVGFGKIGRLVARKASLGLDMKIAAYDPFYKEQMEAFPVTLCETLEELLETSDVVTLHIPLMDSTRKCIGATELKCMKRSAYLINYARGELVDTNALITALQKKELAGAALDVFEYEPVAKGDELCGLPQILLSPHTASFTRESLANMAIHAAITVDEVLSGKTPRWYVVKGMK